MASHAYRSSRPPLDPRACALADAICTAHGKMLSTSLPSLDEPLEVLVCERDGFARDEADTIEHQDPGEGAWIAAIYSDNSIDLARAADTHDGALLALALAVRDRVLRASLDLRDACGPIGAALFDPSKTEG